MRICCFLDKEECKKIVHALVISKRDYCNELLYGLPDSTLKILQQVQNYAACIVTCLGRNEHITLMLHDFHWLPVDMQTVYIILLYTYKCTPPYICEIIKMYVSRRSSGSSSQCMIDVSRIRTNKYGARRFSHAATTLWKAII